MDMKLKLIDGELRLVPLDLSEEKEKFKKIPRDRPLNKTSDLIFNKNPTRRKK